jgi:polyhydroxyalkanoate synthesis regulator phasin
MNPFEIRTQLLEMAKEYLEKQHEINTQFAKQAFEELVKQGQKVEADWKEYMPKMYTFDEVLNQAQKLYGFVSNAK